MRRDIIKMYSKVAKNLITIAIYKSVLKSLRLSRRDEIIVKSVPHVQHANFLPFDQSNSLFMTSSLDAKALYQGTQERTTSTAATVT